MAQEVRVPDIGDFDSVEVIEICAAQGDQVGPDDPLVVIESDKASMEIPAGVAGSVERIAVKVGDQVGEGDLIAELATEDSAAADDASTAEHDEDTESESDDDRAEQPDAADSEAAQEEKTTAAEAESEDEDEDQDEGSTLEVRVPDIGDAKDVSVIEIGVAQGDKVSADDLLVVVESDKASMEIPAGQAGTVTAIHVEIGSSVEEGSLLVSLAVSGTGKAGREKSEKSEKSKKSEPASGSAAEGGKSRDAQAERQTSQSDSASMQSEAEDSRAADVYAGPAVRRLARELGVDLTKVKATGSRGRIVKDDVKAFVKSTLTRPEAAAGGGIPRVPEIDFSKFGTVETVPLTKVRAVGASNLHRSWLNIPHVTQFEDADVTELEEFRRSLKDEAQRREIKLTPLAFIIKACCYALKTHPAFNSSLDGDSKNYIFKKYYNIGFAVDTEQGLVVPVIRGADKLGVWELSSAIVELAEKARTGKLGMTDMQGGSFSISSLGGIGGTGFTPIINAPEVAILGVSRLVTRPVWDGSKFEPRQMLPLSLSYDHRAINGAEAGRFMVTLAELLADIRRLAL